MYNKSRPLERIPVDFGIEVSVNLLHLRKSDERLSSVIDNETCSFLPPCQASGCPMSQSLTEQLPYLIGQQSWQKLIHWSFQCSTENVKEIAATKGHGRHGTALSSSPSPHSARSRCRCGRSGSSAANKGDRSVGSLRTASGCDRSPAGGSETTRTTGLPSSSARR